MSVMVTLGRTETCAEAHGAPDDQAGITIDIGPFDYVELTYQWLRTSPDGDFIGEYHDGAWFLHGHKYPFSDIDIYATKGTE